MIDKSAACVHKKDMAIEPPLTTQKTPLDLIAWAGLILMAICLGSTFYFNSLSLTEFHPAAAGAFRILITALCLVPLALASGAGLPNSPSLWMWSVILGLITMFIPFFILIWAQTRIQTSIASIIFASIPLITLFLSRLVFGVRISARKWGGIGTGSAGLVLLAAQDGIGLEEGSTEIMAVIGVFLTCLCFSGGAILVRLSPPSPPMRLVAGASIIAAALSLPIALYNMPREFPGPIAVTGVLSAALISTALGQILRYSLVRRKGPIFITPNSYLAAFVGAALGVTALGEPLSIQSMGAFGILLVGIFIAADGSGSMKSLS